MLTTLETHFLNALQAANGKQLAPSSDPVAGPESLAAAPDVLITVNAHRLQFPPPATDDVVLSRAPACPIRTQQFTADGTTAEFRVDVGIGGEILEVESPPGRTLRIGDDYSLEGSAIKLFRPPPPAAAVVAMVAVRGTPMRGYVLKRLCQIELSVTVSAGDRKLAESWLNQVLASTLAAAVDLGNIAAPMPEDLGVRLRLLHPECELAGIERSVEQAAGKVRWIGLARFAVRGILEESVAVGSAAPQGIIQRIEYRR